MISIVVNIHTFVPLGSILFMVSESTFDPMPNAHKVVVSEEYVALADAVLRDALAVPSLFQTPPSLNTTT